ncbi:hypothetical protein C8R46DRAFT_1120376 [Mycena filopes]|nr:hypothetical protein C8R46DRAFT_1120376 [Mycena filopes]
MPKRIPTPEPGDDEPKYFTVVQPYPLNANWELRHDYPFFALFYKPSARGQVLIEINRDYPHPERLLGEHRWSEFLRTPSVEEAGRVSQIFYSVYNTGRSAQKDGWKRINVSDSWFKDWTPLNRVIQHPYPQTSWCPLPPEDRTNKPMCRPLPVSVKPPPPPKAAAAPIVPGSATWVNQKDAPPTNTPAALRGAWAASAKASVKNANASNITANNTGGKKNAKQGGKAIPPTSSAPWHTATGPKGNNIVPIPASAAFDLTPTAPAFPPGITSFPLPGEEGFFPGPPGLTRDSSASTSASSASTSSAYSLDTKASLDIVTTGMGRVNISISPSMEAHLYSNLTGAGAVETSPDPNAYVAEWERMPSAPLDGFDGGADALWPASGFGADSYDGGGVYKVAHEEVVESLWGEDDDNLEKERKKQEDILCTVHGIICKKGICKEYARMLREAEREKAAKERGGKNSNNGGGRRNDNNKGGWKKKGANPWDDDSGSATGSEGRGHGRAAPPKKAANEGWSTVRGR